MIPNHIAIVMDGNRRWAKAHKLPILEGHRRVATIVLEKLVEHAAKRGISFLTLWAWSTENWGREKSEVKGIMQLLRVSLKTWGVKMHKKGIRIKVVGDMSKFDSDLQKNISYLVDLTKHNTKITVIFALNYGGRDEILRAIKKLCKNPKFKTQKTTLTIDELSKFMDTAGIPDPELIVRTGGEQRLSGFLLWQSQYSELMFPAWYMPEFTPEKLDEILLEFDQRQRRFGK